MIGCSDATFELGYLHHPITEASAFRHIRIYRYLGDIDWADRLVFVAEFSGEYPLVRYWASTQQASKEGEQTISLHKHNQFAGV